MSKRKTAKISLWAYDPLSFGQGVATQRQTKLKLAYAINRVINNRKLLRAATAGVLDLTPQKVANLRRYNLRGFSIEELTELLTAMNRSKEVGRHRRH